MLRIYPDLPPLTRDEIHRCWMLPATAATVAGLLDDDKDHRKFFENLSAQGILPFRKSSEKRTAPRLHSLAGALKAGVAWSVVQRGNSFETADVVGQAAVDLLERFAIEHEWRTDLPGKGIAFDVWQNKAKTQVFDIGKPVEDIFEFSYPAFSVLHATDLIRVCIGRYGEVWYHDLIDRKIIKLDRHRGCDLNGNPLDPNHPWNRDLPPEQKAKRLEEIDRYIESLEEQEASEKALSSKKPKTT